MKTFSTVANLTASSLKAGVYIETYGSIAPGDTGAARYYTEPAGTYTPVAGDVTVANGTIARRIYLLSSLVSATPPGTPVNAVQFNLASAFTGSSSFLFDPTANAGAGDLQLGLNTTLSLGATQELLLSYNGASGLITNTIGDLLLSSSEVTASTRVQLATDTSATSFIVENASADPTLFVSGNGQVGVGTVTPDGSAIFQVNSITQGSIPNPRMTNTEKLAISTPTSSLSVYNSDTNVPEFWNGAEWKIGSGVAILSFGADSVSTTTTTRFLYPWYSNASAPTSTVSVPVPYSGTISKMFINWNGAGNGNNVVFTLLKNGVPTAIQISLASTAGSGSDLVNIESVVAGDVLSLRVTKAIDIGISPTDIAVTMILS